jgi:hypothetical protein
VGARRGPMSQDGRRPAARGRERGAAEAEAPSGYSRWAVNRCQVGQQSSLVHSVCSVGCRCFEGGESLGWTDSSGLMRWVTASNWASICTELSFFTIFTELNIKIMTLTISAQKLILHELIFVQRPSNLLLGDSPIYSVQAYINSSLTKKQRSSIIRDNYTHNISSSFFFIQCRYTSSLSNVAFTFISSLTKPVASCFLSIKLQ